jgi:hypothetical protein
VGDGSPNFTAHLDPIVASGINKIKAVAVASGQDAVCVINDDATQSVSCWSFTDPANINKASQIPGVANATQVSIGNVKACALLKDGSLNCWRIVGGVNPMGIPEPNVSNLTEISVGDTHACAIQSDKSVVCWGNNFNGQLGIGTIGSETEEVPPTVVPGIQAISVSAGLRHTCAVLTDRSVRCWGANDKGELGNGSSGSFIKSPTPQMVVGVNNAERVSCGWEFSCAVLTDRTVTCWGRNEKGTLGNGTTTDSAVPVPVKNLKGMFFVSSGADHACASGLGGIAHCWGENPNGQLTDGTKNDSSIPVP